MSIAGQQRDIYDRLVASRDAPFIVDRPAMFSPAAAAQDASNSKAQFGAFAQLLLPLQYAEWTAESTAHVESCYLGDWSSLNKIIVSGRGALEFLGSIGMNDLTRFELGQVKHHVQLDEQGRIASEGVLLRLAEEEFMYTAGSGDWLRWRLSLAAADAEDRDVSPERFIFGVQGPNSLFVLEAASAEKLRDIAFNRSRLARIAGANVRVLRTGISGELGYEVHGSADDANEVWSAITEAGKPFGLQLLGFRAQAVQHIEAGIATNGLDYLPSSAITPGAPTQFRRGGRIGGSFVPKDGFHEYFRTPHELGWGARGRLAGHDFLGRDALADLAAAGGSPRTLVGLRWNAADVLGVFGSLLDDGEPAEVMELPRFAGPSFDQVLLGGQEIGVSSGRTLSMHLRCVISLCVIDREHATAGTEVVVLWGRPGTSQREIRATVSALPFKPDHRRIDVGSL